MKFQVLIALVGLCLVAMVSCENPLGLSDSQLKALANLDPSVLPKELQSWVRKDNTHWCCASEIPINTLQRTRIGHNIKIVTTKYKVGYTSCGFMGSMRCSVYSPKTKQVIETFIETYEVPDEQACPADQIKCCKGYIEVAGNCHELTGLSEHMDTLQQLIELGLISGK